MKAKQYRLQRSEHRGVVNRAFGGRVVSWSPWRTAYAFTDKEEAEACFRFNSGRGLTRWRLMYGAEKLRESA